ncbi:glycine cleavage system protein R [Saccharospirillum impatiens]|uniref:glycine cleavage system protein R n=1 Tax=Saccharospirillum impatiens TaxID=169438 RepID=UPI0004163DD3|nr:ACT domain-containing protein [Saccharospirillum impatiens]
MEIILSIMASDRPGIVEQVASAVADAGGSWQESRLSTMAGRFAGIVRVNLDSGQLESLRGSTQALSKKGLSIQIEVGDSEDPALHHHRIAVVGNDRTGIVAEVTRKLATMNINLVDVHTDVEPASMSGGVLFRAELELGLTDEQNLDSVIQGLEGLSADLMVDVLADD